MLTKNSGQAFIYVLKGEIEIITEDNKYKLSQGDSFYYYSGLKNDMRNINCSESEIIWLVTTAIF